MKEIKHLICVEFDWQNKRKDPIFTDKINLAAYIAELIKMNLNLVVPPILMATIIIKIGLDKLCEERSL